MSKDWKQRPECLLYVCCGSKCKKRGGKQIYKRLKADVKENRLKQRVKVIRTSCTDNCKHGPMVAVMPQNEWWTHVDEERARGIFKLVFDSVLREPNIDRERE